MKLRFFILLAVLLSLVSCRSIKGLSGNYEFSGAYSYTKFTLNDDGTFVQIRNFEGCKRYFYGQYKKVGRFIQFTPENNRADLMYKEDYFIQGYDAYIKEKRLYVLYRGDPFLDSLKVQFSDGKSLYTKDGYIELPADFAFDSIGVFGPGWSNPRNLLLKPEPNTNLYFFVFNDKQGLIGCWDWLFINQVKIKNRNLVSMIKRKGKSLVYRKQG
ncbi:MAG: hypothetical protein HYZ15_05985 [Sphingobacteriales bacterium]|nr:hypothetical protein [Sphingobacteriales bacterium]